MRILHTSDWHLGRLLYGQKRYVEFKAFLDWLEQVVEQKQVDLLLVAGDIFDTTTPSNQAQELYYQFLARVSHKVAIVIIAGNHDSATFLNAPKSLLHALNVYVVGAMEEKLEEEIVVPYQGKQALAVICAVPYLRDRDMRTLISGEGSEEKAQKWARAVEHHYQEVVAIAQQRQQLLAKQGQNVPLIAMGHLFCAGAEVETGEGVRDLYVGNLSYLSSSIFPSTLDYVALGHLHIAQVVANQHHIRYSGSPLPMGFGEAQQRKVVLLVDFGPKLQIEELTVPRFQPLERIVGDWAQIKKRIAELKFQNSGAWLEIDYQGEEIIHDLVEAAEELVAGSSLEIRRIKNRWAQQQFLTLEKSTEELGDLDVEEVFRRCLEQAQVAVEDHSWLQEAYQEVVRSLQEEAQ